MRRSLMACLISLYLHSKKMTAEGTRRALADTTDKLHYKMPKSVPKMFPNPIEKHMYGRMEVYESAPTKEGAYTIMYFHGGAYCRSANYYNWRFLKDMVKWTGCGISLPIYPVTPNHTYKESHKMVMDYYKQFVFKHDMSKVIIVGDSAGGGFALSLMQQARDILLPLPQKMVLISPFVDIQRADKEMDPCDAIVDSASVLLYGRAWANGSDLKNQIVSPVYGDMHDLPKTDIWAGQWEVLYSQIIDTYDKMKDAGVDVTFHLGQKMTHDFPLYPMREAKKARKQIAQFILN